MIKLFEPYIGAVAREYVQRVLQSTQLAQGPEVDLFEAELAATFGFEPWQIVTVNSGTSALELAYEITGIDEMCTVVSPVLTCTATNIPLVRRKARLLFGDIEGRSNLNLDPEDLQYKIQSQDVNVAVFVHFGGSSYGLGDIENMCEENGVELICDAAQALGSRLSKKARFSCVSLQAIKSLTSGDGGFLVCRDREDAEIARKLRWYGYDREKKQRLGDDDLTLAGYKYHMNDISAAIGRGNLEEWDHIYEHRNAINDVYAQHGEDKGYVRGVWNPCVIGHNFKDLQKVALSAGFEIGQYHYRNDKYSIFRSVFSNCPNMDVIDEQYFMLPCHMGMSSQDAELIAKTIWH